MTEAELARILDPIFDQIAKQSSVAERFIDKEAYQIYLATLWANLVMDPSTLGLSEDDLEAAHDIINRRATDYVGNDEAIKCAFKFLNSKPGERAMDKAKINQTHRDLLLYFCSMILDPKGHKEWMDEVRK